MVRVIGILFIVALVMVNAAHLFAGPFQDSGIILAVNEDDQTLLLKTSNGFELLVIAPDAQIHGLSKAPSRLEPIRPGDRVEFVAQVWGGMNIATSLHVAKERTKERRALAR